LLDVGHEVAIFSLGTSAERSGRVYARFSSVLEADKPVVVKYATAIDVPMLNQVIGLFSLWSLFKAEQAKRPFDVLIIYNFGVAEALVAKIAARRWHIPIVAEYEDDTDIMPDGRKTWKNRVWRWSRVQLRRSIQGVISPSPELLAQFDVPHKLLLRGVLGDDLYAAMREQGPRRLAPKRFLFAGTIEFSKGVDLICEAWRLAKLDGTELEIVGEGSKRPALQSQYEGNGIRFHGLLSRDGLLEKLTAGSICVNAQRAGQVKPGSVFPFKMIEYLGSACPVISTRMGYVEPELEVGIRYAASESPADLAAGFRDVFNHYDEWAQRSQLAQSAAWASYGSGVVMHRLNALLQAVLQI
jgi:glycosyltransferase involved in cell wall biosynthesis